MTRDLVLRLASVLFHCGHDLITVSFHGRLQLPQLFLPLFGGRGSSSPIAELAAEQKYAPCLQTRLENSV